MTRTLTLTAVTLALALPAATYAQDAGTEQIAAQIGVEAERFTAEELVELRTGLADGNRDGVNLILQENGSDLTYDQLEARQSTVPAGTNPAEDVVQTPAPSQDRTEEVAKAQLAGPMGVDPDLFTLTELVQLRAAVDDGNDHVIRSMLSAAGSDKTTLTIR